MIPGVCATSSYAAHIAIVAIEPQVPLTPGYFEQYPLSALWRQPYKSRAAQFLKVYIDIIGLQTSPSCGIWAAPSKSITKAS